MLIIKKYNVYNYVHNKIWFKTGGQWKSLQKLGRLRELTLTGRLHKLCLKGTKQNNY
jgi:hypothetical protein